MTPAESMQGHLKDLSEDVAKSVEVQTETAATLQTVVENQRLVMEEVASLRAEVGEMIALFKNYVTETNHLRSEVRKKLAANG